VRNADSERVEVWENCALDGRICFVVAVAQQLA
jgi:hypothetical protein